MKKHKLKNGKSIDIVRNIQAVNFAIQSCTDKIVDLIHIEMIVCNEAILKNQSKVGVINEAWQAFRYEVYNKEGLRFF